MAFNSRVEAVVKGILPVPDSWRATQTHASVATSEEVVKNVTNGEKVWNSIDPFFLPGTLRGTFEHKRGLYDKSLI